MNEYLNTRFTVSSFPTERKDSNDKPVLRWNVWEDSVAIFETGSEQEARSYADALTANLARLAR